MTAGRSNTNQLSTEWCTPPKYVEAITEFFDGCVELDPCSNYFSIIPAKIKYCLPANDGLKKSWNYKTIFVNPPYGRNKENKTTIKDWIKKCLEAYINNKSEVIALIPVATNTSHWKEYIYPFCTCVCFLFDTRLKFMINGSLDNKGAPMSCALIYWGKNKEKFKSIFSFFGAIATF